MRAGEVEAFFPTACPQDFSCEVADDIADDQAFGSLGHHKALLVDVNFCDGVAEP